MPISPKALKPLTPAVSDSPDPRPIYHRLAISLRKKQLVKLLLTLCLVIFFSQTLWAQQAPNSPKAQNWGDFSQAQDFYEETTKKYTIQTDKGAIIEPEISEITPFKFPKEVFIVLEIIFLSFLIFFLIRALINYKKSTKKFIEPQKETPNEIDTEALEATGLKADLLAKEGLIIEAMHSILLQTIEELKKQLNLIFPTSLTSREIVYNLNLGAPATQALGDIVTTVEPTWFGDTLPTIDQYYDLRRKLDLFVDLLAPRKASQRPPDYRASSIARPPATGGGLF
jgi:hypothetical protein